MNRRTKQLGLLAALPILLAGCASAAATDQSSATKSMSPGMSMPGLPTKHADRPAAAKEAGPSATAKMICGPEIRTDVAKVLALSAKPPVTATWAHRLYTCTYRLPAGRLVISVKESGDVPSAHAYFTTLRGNLGAGHTLRGLSALGLPAYETTDGTVVFVKDDKTLHVDGTGLPRNAANGESRTNLAYTVATDILGCWNGK
ncbi:MAG TPA: hypothetical protein VGH85_10750 [Mycobacteriales bacterium]